MNSSKIVIDKFLPWYKSHGYSARALGYGSPRSQEVRFEQFIRGLDLHDASVLDVGCGFGDFFQFLLTKGVSLDKYVGVDILDEFIQESKKRVTDARCTFLTRNFVDDPVDDLMSDYVIACATLNTNFPNRDEFVKRFLTQMWGLSRKGIGFSMECVHGFKDRKIEINLDPAYWLDFVCRNLSHKMVLYSDYHDADFTICVYKD